MPILQRFTIKELSEVQPGELVVFDFGGRALGIVMARNENDATMQVLLLSSTLQALHPCWVVAQMDDMAMTFGSEWVLELGDGSVYPSNYDRMEEAGTIVISPEHTVIRAGGDGVSPRSRSAYFDLIQFRQNNNTSVVSSAVCVRDWKIWYSESDRTRVGAAPIFTFLDPTP